MSNRERAWTAEQVENAADDATPFSPRWAQMLHAYATTLRQQGEQAGGVVDEAMVDRYLAAQKETIDRLDRQWGTNAGGSNFVREACKAGLQAALAQNAQGDAVAWLSIDSIGERYLCFTKPNDNDPCYPLYLHAERARVPAGWRETILAVIDALDKATGDSDPNIDPDMTDEEVRDEYPEVWSMQQLTAMLAAAERARVPDGWSAWHDDVARTWAVRSPTGDVCEVHDRAGDVHAEVLRQLAQELAAAPSQPEDADHE